MNRTLSSPIIATAQLVMIMFVVPVWFIQRLGSSLLPVEAPDILLLGCTTAWFFLARAIIERDDQLDPLKVGRGTPMWWAHRLVDQSLLGVGTLSINEPTIALATALQRPRELSSAELPPPRAVADFGRSQPGFEEAGVLKSVPTLHVDQAVPEILETEEYLVGRGDTYWSIAELTLGDGRDWTRLQELNLGREVAPDVFLADGDELRIGWSILVPAQTEDENQD